MIPSSSGIIGRAWRAALGLGLALGCASAALAQGNVANLRGPKLDTQQDRILKEVRLEQKLNASVPLDIPFKDETGKDVKLGDYFQKPVMLMLIQLRCTMLCTEQMNVLEESLRQLQFTAGKEFNLLIVSIDPREKPDLAAEIKTAMIGRLQRAQAAAGTHVLTGDEASIQRLSDAVGFHFMYDARTDQYAHPDGVMILTPKGRVARYFFRLEYPARDLRYGLIQAAENRIGSVVDAIALLCFHYNPVTGKYGLVALNVVRLAGLVTVLMMVVGILVMKRRDRTTRQAALEAPLKLEG